MADEMDYMEQAKELADSYRLLVRRRDMLRQHDVPLVCTRSDSSCAPCDSL